jgi:hypothetical protein
MLPLGAEVAGFVLLEIVAIDDDRRRRLVLLAFFLLARILVGDDERQPLAVGRPCVLEHVAVEARERARFAARAIEQPDLLRILVAAAPREEREIFAVGTPAWRVLALLGARELQRALAVPARHPDVLAPLVLDGVRRAHRVSDPVAFRRNLRIVHVLQRVDVVRGQRASFERARGIGAERGREQHDDE